MKQKIIDWRIVVTGIVCITLIELLALYQGINGVLVTGVIAVIAAVIGVTLPQVRTK